MQRGKEPLHNHKFDSAPMNTINTFHQTMLQPRSTGFIDFNLQTKRPAFPINKAHEHRFQYLNHFPETLSTAKHVPRLNFKAQVPRKEQEKISMSESCFSHEKVDMIKRKAKGTLQFGKSTEVKQSAQRAALVNSSFSVDSKQNYSSYPVSTIHSPVLKFSRQ